MKICFLGAGALGCALGGALTEAGNEVWLVNRSQAHVDAINAKGLVLREDGIDRLVAARASTSTDGIGAADLVVVLVKSFHTREAIAGALALVGPDTVVMSLQNGLGHEEILAEVVGRGKVLAGKTYVGGLLLAPGQAIAGVRGKLTHIGELDGRVTERARWIADTFTRAGLETTVSENIMGTMWDKLLVNVATGALSAITRLPYGRLYAVPEIEACAIAAVGEAMAVAAASGIRLSSAAPRDAWTLAAEGMPPEFKTSMLQSLEKGQPTEIDYINGAVVRWGKRCGVATPVNRTLVACVKGIELALKSVPPNV